jgi:hypothetical protein
MCDPHAFCKRFGASPRQPAQVNAVNYGFRWHRRGTLPAEPAGDLLARHVRDGVRQAAHAHGLTALNEFDRTPEGAPETIFTLWHDGYLFSRELASVVVTPDAEGTGQRVAFAGQGRMRARSPAPPCTPG